MNKLSIEEVKLSGQEALEELAVQILAEAFAQEGTTSCIYTADAQGQSIAIEVTTAENFNKQNEFLKLTDDQLTEIYKSANNIGEGKNPPISTKFIFAAMRAAYKLGKTGS